MGFSKWFSSRKNQNASSLTMADVVRGIQHSVNSSVEIAEQHYSTSMQKFFDPQGNILTKRVYVQDNYAMDLPIICLSGHNSLVVDEMKVKMNVCIKSADIKKASIPDCGYNDDFEITRSSFAVELGSPVHNKDGTANVELEMRFKAVDPPEAVCRLIEQLNNAIAARFIQPTDRE